MNRTLPAIFVLAAVSTAAQAQSSVTLYGNIDQYLGHIRSSSGESVTGLYDGAVLRSRIGFRGVEDLGGGMQAKFQLEGGFNTDNGSFADSSRLFDRQAWVGINTAVGEFRFGRQNTQILAIGGAIDYTERTTFGSIINSFGVPSRYNNDISYRSPRIANLQLVAHYALGEIAGGGASESAVYQLGLDWAAGPYRIGYAGLAGKPRSTGTLDNKVQYHNVYGTYDYGKGKVYLAAVRTNNVTAATTGTGTGAGAVVTNNGASILSNVGNPDNTFAGTNADVRRFYHLYQVSADYRVTSALRVGALYGVMQDQANDDDAHGGNIGAYYDLSKRTTLYAFANYMKNKNNAGFRFSGSAGPNPNLSGADVNGRSLTGYQAGVLHRF